MPRYDQERVVRLVSELRKALDRLHKLSKLSSSDFRGDLDKVGSAKYHFIVAIEISSVRSGSIINAITKW